MYPYNLLQFENCLEGVYWGTLELNGRNTMGHFHMTSADSTGVAIVQPRN